MNRAILFVVSCWSASTLAQEPADIIFHDANVVTVDGNDTIAEAIAIRGDKIVAVGSDEAVLKFRGPNTQVIELDGKTVLPGLIDSHVHPSGAAMHEFDHAIPDMNSVQDVLDYVAARAKVIEPGKWITVRQVFITRLKERRYPTKAELDAVAPNHPVEFGTGPDSSVNSLALKVSGIDKEFKSDDPAAKVEKDPATGEPTGILRSAGRYLKKSGGGGRTANEDDRANRLQELFADYNANGITGIVDRNASGDGIKHYQRLLKEDRLTVRVAASKGVGNSGSVERLVESIKNVAGDPLRQGTPMLRVIGIKCFLDGGMLTGSAYMREPWGLSKIYSIDDPAYRGLLYIPAEKLVPMVRAAVESGLQFTAHSVGDGAVHALLAAYEEVNKSTPVAASRPCLTHSNFMSAEAVATCAKLGVMVDIQPAWLWLDGETLTLQFGYDRLRYFQPLKSLFAAGAVVGGGSDHMQKIGPLRSVNPYHPFLGMEVTQTRLPRGMDKPLHPEEALTPQQALRMYTINNAKIMFLDDVTGSLEPGKLADLIVVDRDPLTTPAAELRNTQVLRTYVGGKLVYEKK